MSAELKPFDGGPKLEDAPFWLAMLRIYKELAWQLDRGPRRDQVHDAMDNARERWLRGDE